MSILLVCGDPERRAPLQRALKSDDVGVQCLDSVPALFAHLGPDEGGVPPLGVSLIVIDTRAPGGDGIAACRQISTSPRLRIIPVILIAAAPDIDHLGRAFEAGAADYLAEPLRPEELRARARAALRRHAEREHARQREGELLEKMRHLETAYRQALRLSSIDSLTGIANRRTLDEFLEIEWRRAIRNAVPLSMLVIDVDWFKEYNDHYGHQAGDGCLRRIAAMLANSLNRPGDLVARYGGEEFAVVLPDTDERGAYFVAERLRRRVEALAIPHPTSAISSYVTISAGTATRKPARGDSSDGIITAADNALYRGKNTGRNRVLQSP